MLRALLWSLFCLAALLLVVGAATWFKRDQWLPPIINTTVGSQFGFAVGAFRGLSWSDGTLLIDELEVTVLDAGARLTMRGLQADVDLAARRVTHLTVIDMVLQSPESSGESAGPLLLSELLQQLRHIPLAGAELSSIRFDPFVTGLSASWSNKSGAIHIELAEPQRGIGVIIEVAADNRVTLDAKFHSLPEQHFGFSLVPHGDEYRLSTTVDMDLANLERVLGHIQPESDTVYTLPSGTVKLALVVQLHDDLQSVLEGGLRIDLDLEAEIDEPTLGLSAVVNLEGGSCKLIEGAPDCNGDYRAKVDLQRLPIEDASIDNGRLRLSGGVQFDASGLSLQVAESAQFSAEKFTLGSTVVQNPRLLLAEAMTLKTDRAWNITVAGPVAGELDLPRISEDSWAMSGILNFSGGSWQAGEGRVDFSSEYWSVQSPATWLPVLALTGNASIAGNRLDLGGHLSSYGGTELLILTARHDLDTALGGVLLDSGRMVFEVGQTLADRFPHWPYEWNVTGGAARVEVDVEWQLEENRTKITGQSEFSLSEIDANYDNIAIFGLDSSATLLLRELEGIVTAKPATLQISLIDAGAKITNINTEVEFDTLAKSWMLTGARAELLGGVVSCKACRYSPEDTQEPLWIKVEGIRLEQVLALAEYGAVTGTGVINASLPLRLSPDGVVISNGELAAAEPGGIIRYIPEAGEEAQPSGNESLDLVSKALENYHYDSLAASAQYSSSGDLDLKMRVEGFNPGLYNGQRVHLNLNLSDNIPSLLRSLQAGRRIADLVESQTLKN